MCKGGKHLQPSGKKYSRKTTPKLVGDKCVTSKTSVSKKCGESLPLSGQKSSKKTTPKIVTYKCVASKTSVSKRCGESLPLSGQKSSKKPHQKLQSVFVKTLPSQKDLLLKHIQNYFILHVLNLELKYCKMK